MSNPDMIIPCPNCGDKENCVRSPDDIGTCYLLVACTNCGLQLYCEGVFYKVKSSRISTELKGKDINNVDLYDEVFEREDPNENIIPLGSLFHLQ